MRIAEEQHLRLEQGLLSMDTNNMQFRFWYPTNLVGYLVAWWTSSRFCHVSMVIGGKEWEALPGKYVWGRQPRPFKGETVTVELTSEEYLQVQNYLESCKGQSYDYAGIASFFLPWVAQNELMKFCSELAFRTGVLINIFPVSCYPDRLSPYSIYLLLKGRELGLNSINKSL